MKPLENVKRNEDYIAIMKREYTYKIVNLLLGKHLFLITKPLSREYNELK